MCWGAVQLRSSFFDGVATHLPLIRHASPDLDLQFLPVPCPGCVYPKRRHFLLHRVVVEHEYVIVDVVYDVRDCIFHHFIVHVLQRPWEFREHPCHQELQVIFLLLAYFVSGLYLDCTYDGIVEVFPIFLAEEDGRLGPHLCPQQLLCERHILKVSIIV